MDKMKLNNNDVTVVPRFIDESMLPTIDSIKKDATHIPNIKMNETKKASPMIQPSNNQQEKKSEEKWYIRYKWYIVAIIAIIIVLVLIYMYFNKATNNTSDIPDIEDMKESKKIKSNIIHDNDSVASDLFYSKKLETITEVDDEDFDSINTLPIPKHSTEQLTKQHKDQSVDQSVDQSTKIWIMETKNELSNKDNNPDSFNKYKILDITNDDDNDDNDDNGDDNGEDFIADIDKSTTDENNTLDNVFILEEKDENINKPIQSIDDLF